MRLIKFFLLFFTSAVLISSEKQGLADMLSKKKNENSDAISDPFSKPPSDDQSESKSKASKDKAAAASESEKAESDKKESSADATDKSVKRAATGSASDSSVSKKNSAEKEDGKKDKAPDTDKASSEEKEAPSDEVKAQKSDEKKPAQDKPHRDVSSFEEDEEKKRHEFQESDPFEDDSDESSDTEDDPVVSAPVEKVDVESDMDIIEASDEGNWFLKRVWWEKAEDLFGKIINLNDQIVQLQMHLVTKRNEFDKKIDAFFKEVGTEQTQLISLIGYLLSLQEKELSEDSIKEEISIINKIDSKKESLDDLKTKLEEVSEKNNLLSESLIQLMHLVQECRQYEQKSWTDFKEIGRVLSDEKAKTLYYEIEANYKNVNSILDYIKGELSNFINKTLTDIEQISRSVVDEIKDLNEQDFNIKEIKRNYQDALEQKKRQKEMKKQEITPKKKPKEGFFSKILGWFGNVWKKFKGLFGF